MRPIWAVTASGKRHLARMSGRNMFHAWVYHGYMYAMGIYMGINNIMGYVMGIEWESLRI